MLLKMTAVVEENKTPELEITVLENGIYVYRLTDWSHAGLEQWEQSVNTRLDQAKGNIRSIYDMRGMDTISRRGFEVANRLEVHPKSTQSFSVAIVNSRRMAILVDTLIKMRRNSSRNRILSDFDEAVAWLMKQ